MVILPLDVLVLSGRGWPERLLSLSKHKSAQVAEKRDFCNLCHLNVGIIKLILCTPAFFLKSAPLICRRPAKMIPIRRPTGPAA